MDELRAKQVDQIDEVLRPKDIGFYGLIDRRIEIDNPCEVYDDIDLAAEFLDLFLRDAAKRLVKLAFHNADSLTQDRLAANSRHDWLQRRRLQNLRIES